MPPVQGPRFEKRWCKPPPPHLSLPWETFPDFSKRHECPRLYAFVGPRTSHGT